MMDQCSDTFIDEAECLQECGNYPSDPFATHPVMSDTLECRMAQLEDADGSYEQDPTFQCDAAGPFSMMCSDDFGGPPGGP